MPSRSASQLLKNDVYFTEHAKERVKRPIGQLLTGSPERIASRIKTVIGDLRPVKTIVIGDRSSSFMRGHRLHSDIYVVDGKVERVATEDFVVEGASEIRVSNPAGR
ncbi:MAG: hypothetical protein OEW84_09360, partial [Aigarchaeota archaeon]|nr:hypothetical protein [Aigarchaeota archaeon]